MMDGGSPIPPSPFVYKPQKNGVFMDPAKTAQLMEVKEGSTLADFGCGSGYLTIPLAKIIGSQGKVYAIDVLPGALEHVESRARLENLKNITTIRANLEKIGTSGIEDASVDAVVASNLLFQTTKPEEILKEAHRILTTNGVLIIVEWRPEEAPMQLGKQHRTLEEMKAFLKEQKFIPMREFHPGDTHYGLVLQKE